MKNGRIELDKEIKLASSNGDKIEIKRAQETSGQAYWIRNFHQKNYLFKETDISEKYRSILVQEIAREVDIEFPATYLAKYKGLDGELIEDYRKPGFEYLSGTAILMEYFYYLEANSKLDTLFPNCNPIYYDEDQILRSMNNLETTWNALSHHYQRWDNKEEIVYKMMKKLAKRFCLDFLTMQRDRMDFNWEIEESREQNEADLTPMFDCDRCFYLPSFSVKQDSGENQKVSDIYEKLDYFLRYSDSEYTSFFYYMYEVYTPEKLAKIIEDLETRLNFQMEIATKNEILGSYYDHYEEMTKVVKENGKYEIRR